MLNLKPFTILNKATLNTGIVAAAMFLASTSSFAAEQTTWFGEVADGQWLAGAKLGNANISADGFSTLTTASAMIGYQFSRPIGGDGTASIEFEITTSEEGKIDTPVAQGRWEVQTEALYLTYRTPGTVFFKAKLGVIHNDVSGKFPLGSSVADDVSVAFGFGGGVRLGELNNRVNVEADWVSTNGDNDVNFFSLGGTVEF